MGATYVLSYMSDVSAAMIHLTPFICRATNIFSKDRYHFRTFTSFSNRKRMKCFGNIRRENPSII